MAFVYRPLLRGHPDVFRRADNKKIQVFRSQMVLYTPTQSIPPNIGILTNVMV